MRSRIKCTDEPLGELKIAPDFLPSPDGLAFREESVKVTISLSKKSVDFFKSQAEKHHTQYQRMIRRLLDAYVDAQSKSAAVRSTVLPPGYETVPFTLVPPTPLATVQEIGFRPVPRAARPGLPANGPRVSSTP
jgi:hypothetical protein